MNEIRRDVARIAILWPVLGGLLLPAGIATGFIEPAWSASVMIGWLEWSLLTPMIVWYSERTATWNRFGAARHLPGVLLAGSIHLVLYAFLSAMANADTRAVDVIRERYSRHLIFAALNYSLIVVAFSALGRLRVARQASLHRARLEDEIARAEFDIARTSLRGDEVLGRLREIEQSARTNPAEAERAIYRLTHMLRDALGRHRSSGVEVAAPEEPTIAALLPGTREAMLIAVVFAGFGVGANAVRVAALALERTNIPWRMAAMLGIGWCLAGLLAPLLVLVTRGLSLKIDSHATSAALSGLAAVLFSAGTEAIARSGIVRPHVGHYGLVDDGLTMKLILSLLTVAAVHALVLDWRRCKTELEAVALSKRLHEARLAALLAQLQPHFLFNALNAIVTLVEQDPERAASVTARLRELLGSVFNREQRQEVRLSDEIAIVSSYLDIEHARLGPRLRFRQELGPAVHDALFPSLVLQPLVENAIRHGISPRAAGGNVVLRVWAEGPHLVVDIEDDGVGIQAGADYGVGLTNITERLRSLYGRAQTLWISPLQSNGTLVRLVLPLRYAGEVA